MSEEEGQIKARGGRKARNEMSDFDQFMAAVKSQKNSLTSLIDYGMSKFPDHKEELQTVLGGKIPVKLQNLMSLLEGADESVIKACAQVAKLTNRG